ncbi:MAG: type IIL restriction-modification enzyme MmeI [Pseudomonadota bacterium]
MVRNLSRHAEWLSLIEISGPFLTVSMLEKAFPQGLDAVETPRRQKLKAAYEEWREAVDEGDHLLTELHREWIRLVLTEMLEYGHESLIQAVDWKGELPTVSSQEHAGAFAPDWIVRSLANEKPRLFVSVLPPDTDIESIQRGDGWPVSLLERMTLLCRAHGVRVGLLTDGERWMLVNAPIGSTSSQASWYARLWFQEPVTLKAFQSLLGVRRCFGPSEETLETLLDESLKHHEEVTDTLGEQVRRAVEVLVQCLDKADEDRNRELLRDVKPAELYEAGLTVMMRLVFVLCAEERGLLLSGDSAYDQCYAVSTLRGHLAEDADRHGPEVLDRRYDAWARLLAVFRAVYGGIEHESLRMPALGGSLFDPDRFPFLEGRAKGTGWRNTSAAPLPIDNRTVLLLLNSLQVLEQSGGALLLSYRALDVEQIGHVYEGLLEHTVVRVPRVTVGLQGSQKAKNPNVALAELESARLDGDATLVRIVLEITGRIESAIKNGLTKSVDEAAFAIVLGVCGGNTTLAERIRPFANLLRTDAWKDPIVYRGNSFMVTLGAARRETGTHYTPKFLTESIVTTTLEPVVYVGPAEGKPREEWKLKSSGEILELKVCDPAMGSGAFLVQVCRYLGEKIVESWLHEEAAGKAISVDGEALDDLGAAEPMPTQLDERLTMARRLVAERCLYGVDVNPLAVELAKLSIWLVTLAKGHPFGFLDHNLRSGDSLLGIHRLEQLTRLSVKPETGQHQLRIFSKNIEAAVKEAIDLRKRLRAMTIRDINDVGTMARLDREAKKKLESVELVADAMIGEALRCGGNARTLEMAMDNISTWAAAYIEGDNETGRKIIAQTRNSLSLDLPAGKPPRKPFHWTLEFPEVFERGGFDVVVGNPPFLGGMRISLRLSPIYSSFIKSLIGSSVATTDLCIYFLRRIFLLVGNSKCIGLLLSDVVGQGDSRETGLLYIEENGGTIFNAITSRHWPGSAGVKVAQVHICKGIWNGFSLINGKIVNRISSYLREEGEVAGEIHQLKANAGICFTGHYLMGQGFVISDELKEELISINPNNSQVIFPYIRGDDINNEVTQTTKNMAINFGMRDYHEILNKYPECLNRIQNIVKPERDLVSRAAYRERWWRYAEARPGLQKAIENLEEVIVQPFTAKYLNFSYVQSPAVFAHPLVVITKTSPALYAVLLSCFHEAWVREYCSTSLDLMRYTASRVFDTFPFPCPDNLTNYGKKIRDCRDHLRLDTQQALNSLYNCYHASDETPKEVIELRVIHQEIDSAVASAYGWHDLDLRHGFHETKQGIRFTISEEARREVLQRLLKLNHERFEKEMEQNLRDKKIKKASTPHKKKKPPAKDNSNMNWFNFMNVTPEGSK